MQKNYNENLVAGAAIRDDKGRRISKLFEASHPKMTVGYAKNLIMPDTPTEQKFNFRQSGGGVIEDGVAVIDKVKGISVVWNQLLRNGNFADGTSGWSKDSSTTWSISAGVIHIHKDGGEAGSTTRLWRHDSIPCVIGHKYLYLATVKTTSGKLSVVPTGTASQGQSAYSEYLTTTRLSYIWTANVLSANFELRGYDNKIANTDLDFYVSNINVFDLTLMFGAGNEPSSVEEFEAMFPLPYYAYNEGEIINNKVEKVVTTGRNLFNPNVETEYLSVTGESGSERYVKRFKALPGTYFIKSINNESVYAKSVINGVYGSAIALNSNVTITLNSYGEIWVYTNTADLINSVANNICINLSDPAINGQYFPYEKHELDLSWVKEIKDTEGVKLFEDGMRSAGTAFDEVAKGRAIKRIGVYTFNGTEDWRINPFAQDKGIMAYQCYGKLIPINSNIRCDRFVTRYWGVLSPMTIFAIPKDGIIIETDGAQSLDDFKASLEAKPLDVYYELAEPIEVEYDEKSLTYPVVAGGTEEAIASEPSTAFRADIGYGIDAVKTILDLKARVEALEEK